MKEASQRFMCVAQKRICVSSLTSNSHNIINLINHIVPPNATQQNTLSAVLRLHFRLARCGIEFHCGRQTDPLYNRQDTKSKSCYNLVLRASLALYGGVGRTLGTSAISR